MTMQYVLVTGATGLVGAHVVHCLLRKDFKVRAVVRSKTKAQNMLQSFEIFAARLDFYFIDDLTAPGVFQNAMKDIDGVIHIASPLNYQVADKENELIIPAIKGVQSVLQASNGTTVRRVVMTSSFGAVLDMARDESTPYTYSSTDWNPITYSEAADPTATPQDAYRGSKVLAEQEAWNFVKAEKPQFDLVTLCPSMIFGPVASTLSSPQDLNESNRMIWKVSTAGSSSPLPPARFNFWIDVRDLAEIHVQALVNPVAGGKRYIPVSPEKFNYQIVSEIMLQDVPGISVDSVSRGQQSLKHHINVDKADMEKDFPLVKYTKLKETLMDFMSQVLSVHKS
ncbi:dihydroflavonol-4-reductase [Dactylonectria macrodidyma]|uniref:Dihydroflavonol-4-reductase n=1 Tax=Dactylonectria macrodidyma TaxID=307937 RepID=A0A9P9FNV4_9HYPO|nr:dihydroflavonol-4-reductase [Dactylonectria macrodidyma]